MKKAIINQMFLGFLLLSGLVTYVATINDEQVAKRKSYELQDISIQSMKVLSNAYFRAVRGELNTADTEITVPQAMCFAEGMAQQFLQATPLGQELLDSDSVTYVWKDAGVYEASSDSYNNIRDGRPDSITVAIDEQTSENFWYKFLGQESFRIPEFAKAVDLNQFKFDVDVSFRGVINAGYYNMVGTYEEDEHGCPSNAQFILADKNAWRDRIGDTLATIGMPETKMFFIADGYRRFGNFSRNNANTNAAGQNSSITVDTEIEFDCSGDYPVAVVTPNNTNNPERSDDNYDQVNYDTGANLLSRANVYFDDTSLNFDVKNGEETDHINEIAEKDWGAFVAYMEPEYNEWSGERLWNDEAYEYVAGLTDEEKNTLKSLAGNYAGWLDYAELNGIDFEYDPNGEYVFISEDLSATTVIGNPNVEDVRHDKWNSDNDFSDMSFSMKKLFIPEPVDLSLIDSDYIMNVNCN